MFRKLLPRQDDFFLFFEKHASMMVKSALALKTLREGGKEAKEGYHYIKACEEEADDITHHCIELLHKNFITPIERSDIHHLISTMDDVIDEIHTAAKLLMIYKLQRFEFEALDVADLLVQATIAIQKAILELRKRKTTELIQQQFYLIGTLESQADALFIQALGRLFEHEKDPLLIIKWKDIYEHLEKAMNACDDVGNIIEGILLENE
jgi:uncharacterized protein Yka (UPF0111/DUF47 family)